MKHLAWLAALALAFGMVAFGSEKIAALDGTSWKIDVEPDAMAKDKGEKDWTFKTEQKSESTGRSIWTGTIHEKNIEGKLIMTKKDGAVLTYTFKGNKLD